MNFKTSIYDDPDRKPITWAYIRVSTWSQDLLKEHYILEKFAEDHKLPPVRFLEDQVSGKVDWRDRKIAVIIKQARKGDILLIHEISRISRTMVHILEIMKELAEKEIPVYTVKDAQRYGKDMNSQILIMVMSMVASIEHELISTRTADALAARKHKHELEGKKTGIGSSKLDEHNQLVLDLLIKGVSKAKTCESLPCKCSVSNLNTWLNKRDLNKVVQKGIEERLLLTAAKNQLNQV